MKDDTEAGYTDHSGERDAASHRMINVDGTGAECAAHLMLNVAWTGMALGIFKAPDIGEFIEVRQTPLRRGGLCVHPPKGEGQTDDPDRAFLLVTGTLDTSYTMRGWLWGDEAQQRKYWNDTKMVRPCFLVEQQFLRPVSELRDVIRDWR